MSILKRALLSTIFTVAHMDRVAIELARAVGCEASEFSASNCWELQGLRFQNYQNQYHKCSYTIYLKYLN